MASAEEELPRLEVEFMEAVRRRDMPKLERMLGDGFVLTTGRPGAEVRTRREWLDVTRDAYLIESFRFEWTRVEAYGDAAVVRWVGGGRDARSVWANVREPQDWGAEGPASAGLPIR